MLELAHFFMDMYVREYALPQAVLSQSAMDWLRDYDFPGNVRELQNLMERAVLLANGRPVEPRHFLLENDDWPLFEEDEAQCDPDESESDYSPDAAWAGLDSAHEVDSQAAPSEGSSGVQDALRSLNQSPGGSALASGGAVIPLHEMERIMILKGLEATSGNRTQAADLLGISVRTLRNKLNEYRAAGHPID